MLSLSDTNLNKFVYFVSASCKYIIVVKVQHISGQLGLGLYINITLLFRNIKIYCLIEAAAVFIIKQAPYIN